LFAAKLGKDVVAVEPFHDNILRIHKAAKTENITDKITLIKNGISNKRNIMELIADSKNVGGQYLKENLDLQTNKDENKNNYIVETILFDDMIKYFPKRSNGKPYDKAIIKIDIEGFEVYAFEHANRFFKNFEVQIIFMEWKMVPHLPIEAHPLIDKMFDLFYKNNLEPFSVEGKALQKESWRNWLTDVIWKKK
jgi:FkbM family methyltransferase